MIVFCIICFYLLHVNVWSGRAEHVRGSVGDTITVPCHYNVHKGPQYMCWGRGQCTLSSCNNVIITTDGSKVTLRKSDKYSLPGGITQGNVSLTITNVTEEDAGMYCCRVEIPGWFNDLSGNIIVQINKMERYEGPASVTEYVNMNQDVLRTRGNILETFSSATEKTSPRITETPAYSRNSVISIFFRVATLVIYILLTLGIVYTWNCHKTTNPTASR
ncbi:T-cell immunoglobulin and mucin domain-containing protein 4-like isoform X3 [Lithobates pipiens]